MTGPHSLIRRAYRALLRLLPFEFRAEFGRDIEQAIVDDHEDVRARSSFLRDGALLLEDDEGRETPAWSSLDPDVFRERDSRRRELHNLRLLARLAPGASIDAVRAELATLTPPLAANLPDHLAQRRASRRRPWAGGSVVRYPGIRGHQS